MAKDLHEFIKQLELEAPDDIVRVRKQVNPANYDVTAVMEHLNRRGRRPLGLFEDTLDLHGNPSEIPVLINAFATRERCAMALGLPRDQSKLPLSLHFASLANDAPKPIVSIASTRRCGASSGISSRYSSHERGVWCNKRIGRPAPAST